MTASDAAGRRGRRRQPLGLPGARGGACAVLMELEVPWELRVVSAHRTPDHLFRYAEEAAAAGCG